MIDYQRFYSRMADAIQESAIRKMGTVGARVPDLISFAPGYPAPDTFPWSEFHEIAASLLAAREPTTLQYGATRGFRPLLESLMGILDGRGIAARFEQLLVTTGSQQGLDLVARVLLDPGDVALVELPTYTGAITAFRNAQADLVGVRQAEDGIDLDDLDRVVGRLRSQGRRVRLLYVVPNFQNPTGLIMSRDKRSRLLEAAARLDLLLIEDDPYGELYFADLAGPDDTRPIRADDEDGRVVYLSSFSKTLAPGFRVAWIVAPEPIAAKCEIAKQAADLCSGAFDQRIVWQSIVRGVLAAQAPKLRAHYQHKRSVMESALRARLGDLMSWSTPRGGFFLWANLPPEMSADRLLARAQSRQVIYVAGSAFYVDGSGASSMRLSFSAPSPARIEEGVRRLAAAIAEERGAGQEISSTVTGAISTGGASSGTGTPTG
jgi:2-aminoadipate transaminase